MGGGVRWMGGEGRWMGGGVTVDWWRSVGGWVEE